MFLLTLLSGEPVTPSFGADVSAGVIAGSHFGEWPLPGLHTGWNARYDGFIQDRQTGGPRVGISVFGGGSLGLLQDREEILDEAGNTEIAPFEFLHYGVLGVIRYDPAAPWSGLFGLGFSRLELEDWYDGVQVIPSFVLEGGARHRLGPDGPLFVDIQLRTGWASARGVERDWTDWWSLQSIVSLGVHAR